MRRAIMANFVLALFASISTSISNGALIEYTISSGTFQNVQTGNFGFPKFDPALGTLTRATFNADSPYTYDLVAQNFTSSSSNANYFFRALIRVNLSVVTIQRTVDQPMQSITVGAGQTVFVPAQSFTINVASNFAFSDATALSTLTGIGNASASITDLSGVIKNPTNSPIFFSENHRFSVLGSVEYEYTPIPEPTFMTAAALLVVLLKRYRRR